MKLTVTAMHAILVLLEQLDADVRAGKLKLSGRARLAHLTNANLLAPHVASFQQVRSEMLRDIVGPEAKLADLNDPASGIAPATRVEYLRKLAEVGDVTHDLQLATYEIADLRLDDNLQLASSQIDLLRPMISDFPAAAAAATGTAA
jgi:hypothetical protein